jgi:hypothetical protein
MKTFESDALSDFELRAMLAAWIVPDPPRDLKERVFSKMRPPFEIPAVFGKPWYGSAAISLAVHLGVVALLLAIFQSPVGKRVVRQVTDIYYLPPSKLPPAVLRLSGGGGGGQHQPQPVHRGEAPKPAPKQFIPPAEAVPKPLLPVAPTITAQAPQIVADNYGDPLSKIETFSGGPGSNGLGSGSGTGIGSGNGDGYGPGTGGGTGGGVYRIGGDVSAPVLVKKIEPEYSEQARKAKYSGTVLLSIIVDANGFPRQIRVIRPLGAC